MTRSHLGHLPLWYALKPQRHLPRSQWVHLIQSDLRSSCGSASGGPFYGHSRRREASAGGLRVRASCSWRAGPRKTAEPPADRHTGTHRVTIILRTGNGGLSAPRIVDNDDPKETHLFKPCGDISPRCRLGPESSPD